MAEEPRVFTNREQAMLDTYKQEFDQAGLPYGTDLEILNWLSSQDVVSVGRTARAARTEVMRIQTEAAQTP